MTGFLRPGSLRFKALVAVVLIAISPAVAVWSTRLVDTGSIAFLKSEVRAATDEALELHAAGSLETAPVEALATDHGVRVRLVDPDAGRVVLDVDHDGDWRWYHALTDPFFGPEGRPDPAEWDALRPAITERSEVTDALANADGWSSGCGVTGRANLLVCSEAVRVEQADGVRVLHVQRSVAQSVRTLWEDRFQLIQLTLVILVFAVALTVWLGIRWVRPVESLRDQALARTSGDGRVSTEPLTIDRADELGEVADAFNTLLAALEQRNRANETFAADLAHELKNPIAAVRTASEALSGGKPLTEARAARIRRILDDSSKRMQVVIDRFLELARAEAGLAETGLEPVDLHELVAGLVEVLRVDPRFTGVQFEVERDEAADTWLRGDEERLETAFRNLLINAATFAAADASDGQAAVRVRIREQADGRVAVAIEDTGPGIAAEDRPRIFDRYFSKRQGGTGLGLPLAKAIVEGHGGALSAAGEPGVGAVFTAVFATKESATATNPGAPERARSSRGR
jgi:two-component system sensor histidine kinase ChvG